MTCARPCELIKLRAKTNVYEPMRFSCGLFADYRLTVGMAFYGVEEGGEEILFGTSTVLQTWEAGRTVLFETRNSIYWLVPIDIRVVPHLFADV